jgi:hypothetical protein
MTATRNPARRRRGSMSILQACDDANLFRPWFRRPESWRAWRVFHAALFGLPIEADDLALFRQCTEGESLSLSGVAH